MSSRSPLPTPTAYPALFVPDFLPEPARSQIGSLFRVQTYMVCPLKSSPP